MRYRSAIFVPGRKRPWTEESESDFDVGSGDDFRFVSATVGASVGSRGAPQAEQRWLVSEFYVAQVGQVFMGSRLPTNFTNAHEWAFRLRRDLF